MAWVEKHGSGFRIRYRSEDGSLVSETGFRSKAVARDRAVEIESQRRHGDWVDPRAGRTMLGEWVHVWSDAHDVTAGTWAKYQSHLRNHILPRFGEVPIGQINRMAVKAWMKALRRGLADPTVGDVVSLLSMMLGEAVEEGLIGANPCRKLRARAGSGGERPTVSPEQVRRITQMCSTSDQLLIITAAYTGLRWGELAGLRWPSVDVAQAIIVVDPEHGALHEVNGRLTLGPPKTVTSGRTIHLPPFLVELLRDHRTHHQHAHVFTAADGGLLRRSNFRRRVWLPAIHGSHPSNGGPPVNPDLHFHDLRHSHKTWLIEDGIPEVAQAKRLGHRLTGVRGIYSHVTQPMIDTLLAGLQRRWEHSGNPTTPDHYHTTSVIKINCSHNAPTTAEQPAGDDHQQAV